MHLAGRVPEAHEAPGEDRHGVVVVRDARQRELYMCVDVVCEGGVADLGRGVVSGVREGGKGREGECVRAGGRR